MFDADDKLLYVGKAKNLKNRVSSYFRSTGLTNKTMALVTKIANIEFTTTKTEKEALLLEHNLIKHNRPNYNILLKDDKTYPYILVSDHDFPRVSVYRTKNPKTKIKKQLYGPYPSAYSAKVAVELIYKTFKLRNCTDNIFNNRSRPCLQYQIQRCSAPCVNYVTSEDYTTTVKQTQMFLNNKNQQVLQDLASSMQQHSTKLDFEKAAAIRDKIATLRGFLSSQSIDKANGNKDILAITVNNQIYCITQLQVRDGSIVFSKHHLIKDKLAREQSVVLQEFIGQLYLQQVPKLIPQQIVIAIKFTGLAALELAISEVATRKVQIKIAKRGNQLQWLQMAEASAKQHLVTNKFDKNYQKIFSDLQAKLNLEQPIATIECFDISHTHGALTVASCVVFDDNGAKKSSYRRYNIDNAGGDDYLAMQIVLQKRYKKKYANKEQMPSIVIVDGGKGQLKIAENIFADFKQVDTVLLGIAKGKARKSGLEKIFKSPGSQQIEFDVTKEDFHCLQFIRDEAHRFAISGHRNKRDKAINHSQLLKIDGIGAKKRTLLLQSFGGLDKIVSASIDDLTKVAGINTATAEKIYNYFKTIEN